MSGSLLDHFIPEYPPKTRGGAPLSRESLRAIYRNQGGAILPWCLSPSYFVLDRDWIFSALKSYHDFQRAVTGRPPQNIYTEGIYNCVEFAEGFVAFLDLCHVLHWKSSVGKGKLGVGWACNTIPKSDVPGNHAMNLVLTKSPKGQVELWAIEPQLESIYAQYGKVDCSQFYFALFS